MRVGWLATLLRWVATIVGAAIIIACATVVAVLLFEPLRNVALARTVVLLKARLPGQLVVAETSWPTVDSLYIGGLRWTAGADTLASARRVAFSFDLSSILHRDLRVTNLVAQEINLDIPAISIQFAPKPQAKQKPARKPIFPRYGAIPGLPSIAVERALVEAGSIRLAPRSIVNGLDARLGFDMLNAHTPRIMIERLTFAESPQGISTRDLALELDLANQTASGGGQIWLGDDWPIRLTLASPDPGRLLIAAEDSAPPPDTQPASVLLTILLEDCSAKACSLDYTADVRTPSVAALARKRIFNNALSTWPQLEGIVLHGKGSLRLRPVFRGHGEVVSEPNDWLDKLYATLRFSPGDFQVDSLAVRAPDLQMDGHAKFIKREIDGALRLEVESARGLRPIIPASAMPESLRAQATLEARGDRLSPALALALSGRAVRSGFRVDALEANLDLPADRGEPGNASVNARAADHALALRAAIDVQDNPEARIEMLDLRRVTAGASQPGGNPPPSHGLIRYMRKSGQIEIADVLLTGDYGGFTVNADLDRRMHGDARVLGQWPDPPRFLIDALGLSVVRRDSLLADWRRDAGYEIRVDAKLSAPGTDTTAMQIDASAQLRLPGPRDLAVILPAGARVSDLGPVLGTAGFSLRPAEASGAPPTFQLRLDLAQTPWLDAGRGEIHGAGAQIALDTLALSLLDVDVVGSGSKEGNSISGKAQYDIKGPRLLSRLFPALGESLAVSGSGAAAISGEISAPTWQASLQGAMRSRTLEIPALDFIADGSENGVQASLIASRGLNIGKQPVERLRAAYASEDAGSMERNRFIPGRFSAEAAGRDFEVRAAGMLLNTKIIEIRCDTLSVVLNRDDLRNRGPFVVRIVPDEQRLVVTSLDLAGSLGEVRGEIDASPTHATLDVTADLDLPAQPPLADIPPGLWPNRAHVRVSASDATNVTASVDLAGLQLDGRQLGDVRINGSASAGIISAELAVGDSSGAGLHAVGHVPAQWTIYPPAAEVKDGELALDIQVSRFPASLNYAPMGRHPAKASAIVDASAELRGTTRAPQAHATGKITFTGVPKLANHDLRFEAEILPPDASGAQMPVSAGSLLTSANVEPPRDGGVAAAFVLEKGGQTVMSGDLRYPIEWSLSPAAVKPRHDQDLALHVSAPELTLADYDALIPGDVGLNGTASIRLAAEGPVEDPKLSGQITAKKLRVTFLQQSHVTGDADIKLSGSGKSPDIRGTVQVTQGVIQIVPPAPRLYPKTGEALLWEAPPPSREAGALARSDSIFAQEERQQSTGGEQSVGGQQTTGGQETKEGQRPPTKPAAARNINLDVSISIPSNLRIRGQGLDVELAGDLDVVQTGALPTVAGELNAVSGRLVFMGRSFDVTSGKVNFYGEQQINPTLDIHLTTQVESTTIDLVFGGTVQQPKLTMSSSPEMSESDIISYLLFGRSLEQLDTAQTDLLRQRAADIAASYGTQQLAAQLSRQLGVDILSLERTGQGTGLRTLIIGKYLSPRALLRYEQVIEQRADFLIDLEYLLTRTFKIDTLIGSQSKSAVEFNWTHEY